MPNYLGLKDSSVHIFDKLTGGVLCGAKDFLFFEPFCWGHMAGCQHCKAIFSNMINLTDIEQSSVFHTELI